ncbi:hypothetical protein JYU34_007884 [Plutella xylostella]|uniref:Uncharacterized protein n=1 Tax=Plutella xylostella TaxID=51655 RepID=A0ABQ7QRL8_PLUXY|nr:hypothetical protein JYU34_007884 [Plutella xylostella]
MVDIVPVLVLTRGAPPPPGREEVKRSDLDLVSVRKNVRRIRPPPPRSRPAPAAPLSPAQLPTWIHAANGPYTYS